MKGHITMSNKEANRIAVLDKLLDGAIKQKQAARQLGLSTRQIRRLKKKYQKEGMAGLVHKSRGRISNNKIPNKEINKAIRLMEKHYFDFSPTLALEKLQEHHQIKFGVDTLRQAMIKAEIWKPKRRKRPRIHQLRNRRECEGELVQVDGSPHRWFENRGPACNLLAFMDDATGKVKWLEFTDEETTLAYMKTSKGYLTCHGKPLALYADKHSIFRINTNKSQTAATADSHGDTQFSRAMRELGITMISAHSPQAKGRVERLFETLQDRLVKELRLKGINTIEAGNQYLPEFIKVFNQKFSVRPKSKVNAHRPLLKRDNLDHILTIQHIRRLSINLTCQFENKIYQVVTKRPSYAMRHAPVLIRQHLNGRITIEYKGRKLDYLIYQKQPKAEIVTSKQLQRVINNLQQNQQPQLTLTENIQPKLRSKQPWKPSADNPWRSFHL